MNTSINGFFPRVSLAFARKIDTDLIAFVRNIVTLMAGLSGQYPTPSPALTVITTSVNAFETAVHDALNGGKIEIGALTPPASSYSRSCGNWSPMCKAIAARTCRTSSKLASMPCVRLRRWVSYPRRRTCGSITPG